MTEMSALWLPVLLSSVIVFLASSLLHTVIPWHRDDFRKVPNEDALRAALQPLAIPPGDYMVPHMSGGKEARAACVEKMKQGPNLHMTVMPNGSFAMGRSMAQWFVYCFVISCFAGYVASRALPAGAHYLSVFRFAGAAAFLAHAGALWPESIWYRRAWGTTVRSTVDGLLYAMLTAGTFGWLWPR